IAERLEHELRLAVLAQLQVVVGRVDARLRAVAGERALERVVVGGGHHRAERQFAEEARRFAQLGRRGGRLAQRREKAIAEAAAREAGGGQRARGQGALGVLGVHALDGGEQLLDQRAIGDAAGGAEARAGAQHAAPEAQPLDQRRQLGRNRRGRLFLDGLLDGLDGGIGRGGGRRGRSVLGLGGHLDRAARRLRFRLDGLRLARRRRRALVRLPRAAAILLLRHRTSLPFYGDRGVPRI